MTCQPYRRMRAGYQKQRLIPTRVSDPLNRKLKTCISSSSSNNLMPIPTTKCRLPTLLYSNARRIVKEIDEMTEIIEINTVNIACVTETWPSKEIRPCITDIDGYTCESRDRVDRRGGGVLSYIRNSIPYHRISILECDEVESLWLLVRDKCMPRNLSHILVGVIYHPRVLVTSLLLTTLSLLLIILLKNIHTLV